MINAKQLKVDEKKQKQKISIFMGRLWSFVDVMISDFA